MTELIYASLGFVLGYLFKRHIARTLRGNDRLQLDDRAKKRMKEGVGI